MEDKQAANTMVNASIALFAGVVGSVLTLIVTANLKTSEGPRADLFEPSDSQVVPVCLESTEMVESDNDEQIEAYQALRDIMQEASDERAQLAGALAMLTRKFEDLESDAINQRSLEALAQSDASAQNDTPEQPARMSGFGAEPSAESRISGLMAAGVDPQTAEDIQARQDRFQLARLELFDQAEREGWIESDDFSDRLDELDEQRLDLRDELGDAAYDRYLYELGRSNRVAIASVISGSAADIAGLQSGDTIVSYANQRVFNTRDLQSATRQGLRGEYVPMQLVRSGGLVSAEIPRGPLGVTLTATRREPS